MKRNPNIVLVASREPKTKPALAIAAEHHARALRSALAGVLKSQPEQRHRFLVAVAACLETPAASLAQRLIEMAPVNFRAQLRDDLK